MSGIALCGSELANVVMWSVPNTYSSDIGIAAAALSLISALCITLMLYSEHIHSERPSALVSIYLSITLLLDIARCRSYFLRDGLQAVGGITITIIVLKFLVLVLEEVSKRQLVHDAARRDAGLEAFAGFWNRTLVMWMNSTFVHGFRTVLNVNDLQELPHNLESELLSDQFSHRWHNGELPLSYYNTIP